MIGPSTYNAGFYNGMPRLADQKAAADDAAAAADFARILNAPAAPAEPAVASSASPQGEDDSFFGFIKSVIDVINPLQHIPVVSAIYRHVTGDEMNAMARLAGDAIYGGPLGGALALADIAYEKTTGKDVGATVIAALTNGKDKNPALPQDNTMIAENLNQVSPASGGFSASDIIWDDAPPTTVSQLSPTPALLTPTGTDVKDPVSLYTPTQTPDSQTKDNAISALQPPTASEADSIIALHRQEAPGGASRTDVPPELIAAKMKEALDKYQEMKRGHMAPAMSGVY